MIAVIKQRIVAAMKGGNAQERDILKVVLGDMQLDETRKGAPLTAEECEKVVRKVLKGIGETLAVNPAPEVKAQLEAEKVILESLLPKTLGVDEIVAALAPVAEAIRAAGNAGQATGAAMKHLKAAGLAVQGQQVSEAVAKIRA